MDSEYAAWYTTRIMAVLVREFSSPDEEMKKIVLKVIRQCAATEGVTADYVKKEILPEFFRNFWIRRMALDKRNYKQVVETTYSLAQKVGGVYIIDHIQKGLKDESEPYRKMVLQAIHVIVVSLGVADINERQMELLMEIMIIN
jgi:splicing factor 3B subunit 1